MKFYIYRSERKFNKNYGERWSPNSFIQSLSILYCFLMTKKNIAFKFLFTFKHWLLNSIDLPSYCSELRKRYTLKLFLMCIEEKSFGSCSVWGKIMQPLTFLKILFLSFCHILKTSISLSTSQWRLLKMYKICCIA